MIYLMRHGKDNEKVIGGWNNASLTEIGIKQVHLQGSYLKDNGYSIKSIIASDIRRSKQTAKIISHSLELSITYSKDLREQDKGDLTGSPIEIAKEKYPQYFENLTVNMRYPNGESLIDLYERVKKILPWILSKDQTLFITHRGFINMLYFLLEQKSPNMDKNQFDVTYGSVHELDIENRQIRKIL